MYQPRWTGLARWLRLFVAAGATGACQVPNPAYMPGTTSSPRDAQRESPAADLSGGGGGGGGGGSAGPADGPSPPPADLAGPEAVPPADADLPADLTGPAADSASPGRDVLAPQDMAPSAGLIAAWAFDQRPAPGTTSLDDGLGNTAVLGGSTTWGDDRPANAAGPSLHFPGGGGYVAVTMAPGREIDSEARKTIAFWCKSTDRDTPTRTLIAMYNEDRTTSVGLQIGIGENKIEAWPYGLTFRNVSYTTPTPRSWHHVAYTFEPGLHTLYVDGKDVASSKTWLPKGGALDVIRLGTTDETIMPGNFYVGYLRDLRIYAQTLGPAEVRALAGVP